VIEASGEPLTVSPCKAAAKIGTIFSGDGPDGSGEVMISQLDPDLVTVELMMRLQSDNNCR
jgi:hypothetical protein